MKAIERKILEEIFRKEFLKKEKKISERDKVVRGDGWRAVYLWNTRIANINHLGDRLVIVLDDGGYHTLTTKSRLNAILDGLKLPIVIRQKNWQWLVYVDGEKYEWPGRTEIEVFRDGRGHIKTKDLLVEFQVAPVVIEPIFRALE